MYKVLGEWEGEWASERVSILEPTSRLVIESVRNRLTDWLTDWLTVSVTNYKNEWVNE